MGRVQKSKSLAEQYVPARLADLDGFVGWPKPPPGKTFAQMVDAVPVIVAAIGEIAKLRGGELLARAPEFLSEEDRRWAAEVLEDLIGKYPAATPEELLLILAADAFRPRPRSRPAKSAGVYGADLVHLVDFGLEAMGKTRTDKKAVRAAIGQIYERLPDHCGGRSEEALRLAYYRARRSMSKVA